MEYKVKDFPQFRRLFNGKSYYKIIDDRSFIELQAVGDKWFRYEIKAAQYFEILRLQDMLLSSDLYLICSAEDFGLIEQKTVS